MPRVILFPQLHHLWSKAFHCDGPFPLSNKIWLMFDIFLKSEFLFLYFCVLKTYPNNWVSFPYLCCALATPLHAFVDATFSSYIQVLHQKLGLAVFTFWRGVRTPSRSSKPMGGWAPTTPGSVPFPSFPFVFRHRHGINWTCRTPGSRCRWAASLSSLRWITSAVKCDGGVAVNTAFSAIFGTPLVDDVYALSMTERRGGYTYGTFLHCLLLTPLFILCTWFLASFEFFLAIPVCCQIAGFCWQVRVNNSSIFVDKFWAHPKKSYVNNKGDGEKQSS